MTFLEFRCRYFFDLKKKMFKHSAIHFLSIYSMAAVAAILYMRIAQRGFLSIHSHDLLPDVNVCKKFKELLLILFIHTFDNYVNIYYIYTGKHTKDITNICINNKTTNTPTRTTTTSLWRQKSQIKCLKYFNKLNYLQQELIIY